MKFVLLIYQGTTPIPGTDRWNALSKEEQQTIYKEYSELNNTPGFTAGLPLGLPNAARTVKVQKGNVEVKDGLYLHEGAAGYGVFEAENMEDAIALASRIPAARLGGAIEIRPAEQYW